jgi:hypothetical protein
MAWVESLPTTRYAVSDVLSVRSCHEMVRIAAGWVIAGVPDDLTGRDRAFPKEVRQPIRAPVLAAIAHCAVALPFVVLRFAGEVKAANLPATGVGDRTLSFELCHVVGIAHIGTAFLPPAALPHLPCSEEVFGV